MMRRTRPIWMAMVLGGVLLLGATAAEATANQGVLELAAGKADCRAKRFTRGVQRILKSAVTLQRANPRHPANRQWLPQVRICLRSWIRHVGVQCRRSGTVASLTTLQVIEKKVKYLAAPLVKRLIKLERPRCAAHIVRLKTKTCLADPGRDAIDTLQKLRGQLVGLGVKARTLGRLSKGITKCVLRWVKDADSRCQTDATVTNLKELGSGIGKIPNASRGKARAAYERCAKALGARAWSICQTRRYQQGRALLKEAINRYAFYRARDRGFLKKMKSQWLPRCGTWVATGYFNARVQRGRISFKLAARVGLEVGRTGKGNLLRGEMRVRYSAVSGVQQGCRVLITPVDGRYSLQGSENPGAGTLRVLFEKGMPQTPGTEEVQITCGDRTPDLSKARLMHLLLKRAGLFALSLKGRTGARRSFRWQGALPRGAKGSIAGTLTVKVLK